MSLQSQANSSLLSIFILRRSFVLMHYIHHSYNFINDSHTITFVISLHHLCHRHVTKIAYVRMCDLSAIFILHYFILPFNQDRIPTFYVSYNHSLQLRSYTLLLCFKQSVAIVCTVCSNLFWYNDYMQGVYEVITISNAL